MDLVQTKYGSFLMINTSVLVVLSTTIYFSIYLKNSEYEILEIDKQGRSSQIVNAPCSREIESRKVSGDGGK